MTDIKQSDFNKVLLKATARTYFKEIVKATPGKGIVRDGWDIDTVSDGVLISNKEFGEIILYLEEGTGLYGPKKAKYVIKPKNKKSLRWKAAGGDKFAFAKKVIHPGIKARLFIDKVLNDKVVEKEFIRMIELELVKLVGKSIGAK